jgi:hypothetical protein
MAGKDGLELEYVDRSTPDPDRLRKEEDAYWKSHFLRKLTTPKWKTREENCPTLANPGELSKTWKISWGGGDAKPMDTFAFEVGPKFVTRYIGVALPAGGARPAAWLLYFRHTAKKEHFLDGNLLDLGVGDYFVGRMQVLKQIGLSGKKVGVILPVAFHSAGEFAGNQGFVTQCLHEIESSLFGSPTKIPLLAAANSDGILGLDGFLKGCPTLKSRLIGTYDFDGILVTRAKAVSLSGTPGKVFRYVGAGSPTLDSFIAKESEESFLFRTMSSNPCHVPLALSRWRAHPRFGAVRPGIHPDARMKKGDPMNEVRPGNAGDQNWLHHYIPTCMLHHGLMHTPGL